MPPHPPAAWEAAGVWPDPSAVVPTSMHDRGRVGDPRVRSGGGLGEGFLVDTRQGKRGWICGKFQMPEDLPDHLALRDGGDDPQRSPLTARTARHSQRKDVPSTLLWRGC